MVIESKTLNHGYFFYEELRRIVKRVYGEAGILLCVEFKGEKRISSYDIIRDNKLYHRVFHFTLNEKGEN